ncbi:MAG: orotidine-5'-phosphate decarboxylase [bacterium]
MKPEVIVALDTTDRDRINKLIESLGDRVSYYKIGYIPFYTFGWEIVDYLNNIGKKVMLDLKLDDIPNTVEGAIRIILTHNPEFVTIHSSVGKNALIKAREIANKKTKLLGITILTSLNEEDLKVTGILGDLRESVLKRARLCKEAGLSGVVASVDETGLIKEELGKDFIVITPGIRIEKTEDDQKRAATYREAKSKGVDFVVIGRPIYNAQDPLGVIERLMEE